MTSKFEPRVIESPPNARASHAPTRYRCLMACYASLVLSGSMGALACQSKVVTLGQRSLVTMSASSNDVDAGDAALTDVFRAPRVLPPAVVPVIGSDEKDDNPTLTGDMLEIYFTSTRDGNSDVWFARRDTVDAEFDAPQPVAVVNTSEFESSPAVESDGLTLWVARKEEGGLGGLDIYASRRSSREDEWPAPQLVQSLSTSGDDIPRPPGADGLLMPLSSRAEDDTYHLYLAKRPNLGSDFGSPTLLQSVLWDGYGSVDGFVTWDGEHLLFSYTRDESGDLYIARRAPTEYAEPLPLTELNTDADERDPWVSADGRWLFFASDRDETLRIYQAELDWN